MIIAIWGVALVAPVIIAAVCFQRLQADDEAIADNAHVLREYGEIVDLRNDAIETIVRLHRYHQKKAVFTCDIKGGTEFVTFALLPSRCTYKKISARFDD